jgi:dTDP-4-dehydrorhamnose reductase
MHLINSLYHNLGSVTYGVDENDSTWFEFAKTIRNNILVELNISALSEIYDLNTSTMKEMIGSLNWKKFSERINTSLKDNQNLTQN